MILKRRNAPSVWVRMRNFLWPDRGFARAWRYMKRRLERLNDSPEKVALGFACGAFASFTPFFGLHFIVAAIVAHIARGNIMAALIGTIVGNPLTFPFIAAGAMSTGNYLLGDLHKSASDGGNIIDRFLEIGTAFWEALKGSIGLGSGLTSWSELGHQFYLFFNQVMIPYIVGGAFWGAILAVILYFVMVPVVGAYQRRRRERLTPGKTKRSVGAGAIIRPAE